MFVSKEDKEVFDMCENNPRRVISHYGYILPEDEALDYARFRAEKNRKGVDNRLGLLLLAVNALIGTALAIAAALA